MGSKSIMHSTISNAHKRCMYIENQDGGSVGDEVISINSIAFEI